MPTVRQLTSRYRAQQTVLDKGTQEAVARLWPAIRWDDLDGTYPVLASRLAPLVRKNRRDSSALAGLYLKAAREAAGIRGSQLLVYADVVPGEQFTASLQTTSLAGLKTASSKGADPLLAMRNALTLTQGSMSKLVLMGGRETVTRTTTADPRIIGWQRVGAGECDWCSMLIGRGSVYREETASFEAHGNCRCDAEPVYSD